MEYYQPQGHLELEGHDAKTCTACAYDAGHKAGFDLCDTTLSEVSQAIDKMYGIVRDMHDGPKTKLWDVYDRLDTIVQRLT